MRLPKSTSTLQKDLKDKISQCFIKSIKTSEVFVNLTFYN